MNPKNLIVVISIFCLNTISSNCQDTELAKLYNFRNNIVFNHNYKYLDKDYKIIIDSATFQKAVKENNGYPKLIKSYKDSLFFILTEEFEDPLYQRAGAHTLAYSWNRLGYHIWLTENESKIFASKHNFKHPFKFQMFLEKSNNKDVNDFFRNLKSKINNKFPDEDLESLSRHDLLIKAMRLNPRRINDAKRLNVHNHKNHSENCGCLK